jgi:hypothetical protein
VSGVALAAIDSSIVRRQSVKRKHRLKEEVLASRK